MGAIPNRWGYCARLLVLRSSFVQLRSFVFRHLGIVAIEAVGIRPNVKGGLRCAITLEIRHLVPQCDSLAPHSLAAEVQKKLVHTTVVMKERVATATLRTHLELHRLDGRGAMQGDTAPRLLSIHR